MEKFKFTWHSEATVSDQKNQRKLRNDLPNFFKSNFVQIFNTKYFSNTSDNFIAYPIFLKPHFSPVLQRNVVCLHAER